MPEDPDLYPGSGLPSELEELEKEEQRIEVSITKRRYGKEVTIIKGIEGRRIDLDDLASDLKKKLACGGTVKDGKIELQGNHIGRVKEALMEQGFNEEKIEIHG